MFTKFIIEIEKISKTLKYLFNSNLFQAIKLLDLRTMCVGGPRSIDFPSKNYSYPHFLKNININSWIFKSSNKNCNLGK